MKARFEVSTEGMKELQSGREPWQLAKELIANAWDESTTKCDVIIKSIAPRKVLVSVYDDGGGFSEIADAWTLMGHTAKRGDPNTRGRFNIGEKEILSVAIDATIYTSGKIIDFPKTGGRKVRTNPKPFKGTRVDCHLAWGRKQAETVVDNLKNMLTPKGITYTVNGEVVPYRKPENITSVVLETVLQASSSEPMRPTWRYTDIEIYSNGTKGRLYEMGIPIQSIDCPYSVNVMQKVPMPPNRDVVKDSYLKDIYAAVLNCKHDEIDNPSSSWIRLGIEDSSIQPEAVKSIINKRYGDKAILWSSNTIANERALEHGYEVIHGRTLSENERKAFESVGLVHTADIFAPTPKAADVIPPEEWTDGMRKVANYTRMLGKELLGIDVGIQMYRLKGDIAGATWCSGVISFNVSNLGKTWFDAIGEKQTGLILHELAHHNGNGHDPLYLDSLMNLAGKAVHHAANNFSEFWTYI